MVCKRCLKAVNDEFEKLNIPIKSISLGRVESSKPLEDKEMSALKKALEASGFEIIDDKRSKIVDNIKTLVIEITHHNKEVEKHVNISDLLAQELNYDYSYLSHLFSTTEGITIEKYHILQKIEKAKELLVYDELSLKEIAYQLGYSSVQHLSNQFKKTTGLSPSHFKNIKENRRLPLDEV